MFIVGQLGAVIDADQRPFNRAMGDVRREGDKTSKALKSMFLTAGAALGASFVAAGAMAIKQSAEIESLRIRVDTLVGSAEKGAKVFKELQDFSAGTPFQLNDLVQANSTLVGMGQSSEEAFRNLQMLGDVASATGANINELAVTFGQASAEGKLMTRDIREFINRGVPLTKLLADSMGVAKDEIFDLASESKITFDVLVKALRDATTGTGIYAGATEKAADSIKGSFSTLTDNANILLGSMGDLVVEAIELNDIMKEVSGQIGEYTDSINSAETATSEFKDTVRGAKIVFRDLFDGFKNAPINQDFVIPLSRLGDEFEDLTFGDQPFDIVVDRLREIGQEAENVDRLGVATARLFKELNQPLIFSNKEFNFVDDMLERFPEIVDEQKIWTDEALKTANSINHIRTALNELPTPEIFDPSVIDYFNRSLEDIVTNFEGMGDFSHRIFAAGSIGKMREEIAKLEEQLIQTTDPSRARQLQTEIDNLDASIQNMRHSTEEASDAADFFTTSLADGLDQVLFGARDVEDAINGIIRQLGSRVFLTGIGALFTGGASLGTKGFWGTVFSGFRANGGNVLAGNAYMVGEKGPELFMPGTSGSIIPNGGGSGNTLNLNISLDGKFTQSGTDLEAAIRETVRQQTRLG